MVKVLSFFISFLVVAGLPFLGAWFLSRSYPKKVRWSYFGLFCFFLIMMWAGGSSLVRKEFRLQSLFVTGADAQFVGGGLALLSLCGLIWALLQRKREIKKTTEAEAEAAQNNSEPRSGSM